MDEAHSIHLPKRTKLYNFDCSKKVDRLSALPDFLLSDILSRLPISSAACTSILSHRWRYLWTYHTHIRFHSCFDSCFDRKDFITFCTTVDHILKQLSSAQIRTFHLRFPTPSSLHDIELCSAYLSSWVPLLRDLKPEKISISFLNLGKFKALVPLPISIFECPNLVNLSLWEDFSCEPSCNDMICSSFCLPNMKRLELCYVYMDVKLLGKIVRSCPLLEFLVLKLELTEDELVLDISAPNLTYLEVNLCGYFLRSKVVIDASNLQDISLSGRCVTYCFVSKLRTLQSAAFKFWDSAFQGQVDCRREISEVVQGVCNVRSIRLCDNIALFSPFNHADPGVWRSFSNLTELILSSVSVRQVYRTAPIPVFLLSRLKNVELVEVEGNAKDLKLVKYILRHANVLEKLLIDVSHSGGSYKDNLWSEYLFCESLFELPASSLSCVIKFNGVYMDASRNGYHDSLSCQVNYGVLGVNDVDSEADSDTDSYGIE